MDTHPGSPLHLSPLNNSGGIGSSLGASLGAGLGASHASIRAPETPLMQPVPNAGSFSFAAFAQGAMLSSPRHDAEGGVARERLWDFQRNSAFVGFMLVVCTGALVFLMRSLSEVLLPLAWAAFFAMPLTGFVSVLNPIIISLFRMCIKCCKRRRMREARERERRNVDVVRFTVLAGEAHIRVSKVDAARLLRKVNEVGRGFCGSCPLRGCVRYACQRQVCVKDLRMDSNTLSPGSRLDTREVNRIVKGWKYYLREETDDKGVKPMLNESFLGLYLDKAGHYPAIVYPTMDRPSMRGKLEVDKSHVVSYAIAVLLAMALIVVMLLGLIWLISFGQKAIASNVNVYVRGSQQLVESFNEYAKHVLPNGTLDDLNMKVEQALKERLPELASAVLEQGQGIGFEILLFLLYLLFWVLEPLPVNTRIAGIFKTYLLQKTFVCIIFATLVSLLLLALQCRIWHILFIVAFLLNYIPEIGALMCFAIMLPLLLLDGALSVQMRIQNSLWFIVLFLAVKFITGNVIEVQLYAKSGGDLMRMHPVVMLALMMLFESLMGITGMFMTVPFMAAVKYYILSSNMPPILLDPLLTCIEGSEHGPHINFVEQYHAAILYAPLQQESADESEDEESEEEEEEDESSSEKDLQE